jgi:hypothetical protein
MLNRLEGLSSYMHAAIHAALNQTKNSNVMKKLLTLLAVAASFAVFTPSAVQARDSHCLTSRSHSHNCGSCGSSVYRERVFVGYNRCGEPVYSYRTVGHNCRYSQGHRHSSRHHSHRGYSSGGHISLPGFHIVFGGHR